MYLTPWWAAQCCIISILLAHWLKLIGFYALAAVFTFAEPDMLNPQITLQKNIPALKRRLGDTPDETAFSR